MSATFSSFFYLLSAFCFIMALRGLSSAATSRAGNLYGTFGMAIAILTTLVSNPLSSYRYILLALLIGGAFGALLAKRLKMTALPQLIAGFHSLVGLAAVLVTLSAFYSPEAYGIWVQNQISMVSLFEMGLGGVIGAITFTGSLVAFGKLQGLIKSKSLVYPGQHHLNALLGGGLLLLLFLFVISGAGIWSAFFLWLLIVGAFALGFLLILPIGGADMPVVISMLNSYSGWAAAGIGFTLSNPLLIITGALVGSSGAILSHIMCKGMNRSIFNVILGGFGAEASKTGEDQEETENGPTKISSPEDAAFILSNARSVIVVPGYGMAVAHAQHALQEMAQLLQDKNISVRYAIHPVAGRMPGHMNVLLAELYRRFQQ